MPTTNVSVPRGAAWTLIATGPCAITNPGPGTLLVAADVALPASGSIAGTPVPANETVRFDINGQNLYARPADNAISPASVPVIVMTGGQNVVANTFKTKFRDAFQTWPNSNWTTPQSGAGDLVRIEGNAAGASYLTVSLDPLTPGTETWVESVGRYAMPLELAVGAHISQRVLGQEFSIEVVSDETPTVPADVAISSIQQATTTLTVTTATAHGLRVGQRIGIRSCADSRFNYPALVVATTPSTTQFTATAGPGGTIPSVTAGPFASGFVYYRSAMGFSPNGTSVVFDNATATNASFYAKAEGGDMTVIGGTIAGNHSTTINTTASVQAINAALNYAFRPTSEYRLSLMADRLQWADAAVDATGQTTARATITQVVPNPDLAYKIRIRGVNTKGMSSPVAQIVSAVKTGTTTATVVTGTPHGLTTGDLVVTYGVRDTTNFANLTTATAVASVVDTTTFTVVWGSAVTATSYGGYVARVNGGALMSAQGAIAQVAQSVSRTSNVVTLVGSASWSGVLIGDYVNLVGIRDNSTGAPLGLDGSYRVRDIQTTSLFLDPIGSAPTGTDVGSVNCGGAVIKRTDLRVSFIRLFDYERARVEVLPRPSGDVAAAAPVAVQNSLSVTVAGTQGDNSATIPNHVPGGVKMLSAQPTAGTTGRTTSLMGDLAGRQIIKQLGFPQANVFGRVTLTTTTETTLIAAVASNRLELDNLVIANRDSAATTVDIRDTTGGTVRWSIIVPAGQTVAVSFRGVPAAAVNTNLTAQLRGAATTAVEISANGYLTTA